MPDITMCEGKRCPVKDICHRYTAIPDEYYQSWFVTIPYDGKGCEYFWEDDSMKQFEDELKDSDNGNGGA